MNFFNAADDLFSAVTTTKPAVKPLPAPTPKRGTDTILTQGGEKKPRLALPTEVILVEGAKKQAAKPKAEDDANKHWAHQFGDIEDRKACQHEMCLPPDYSEPVKDVVLDGEEGKEPVRKYPFTLDPFQKVLRLRMNTNMSHVLMFSQLGLSGDSRARSFRISECAHVCW